MSRPPKRIHAALQWGAQQLANTGQRPDQQARWLLAEVCGQSTTSLLVQGDTTLSEANRTAFATLIARRKSGEPLQHVLGHTEFYGLRLAVNEDVLVPRPETEIVVEKGLELIAGCAAPRVFDAGTGSGCIACAIKHEHPSAEVAAGDVSEAALRVARQNASALQLDIDWVHFDMAAPDAATKAPTDLDLLISNPPYIPDSEADTLDPVVRNYDPPEALFAGDDALHFYRTLADWGRDVVKPGGYLLVETHDEGATAVAELFRAHGWTNVDWARDLADRPRMVWGQPPPVASSL